MHFFCRKHHEEHYFEFGPVVQEEMSLKGISYLELWRPFCSAERNTCAILVEYQKGQFEFRPLVQEEMSFKRFLIWSSGGPCVLVQSHKFEI